MKISFLGHGCILLETHDKRLLVDPFITPNEQAKDIVVEDLHPDYILLTHAHQDHLADAERIALRTGAKIISTFEVMNFFEQKGCSGHGMNIGGKHHFDFGMLKMVNAVHTSSFPDGTYGGHPVGFVIWNSEACIYLAGDTGLLMDMQLIPMTCPAVDMAVLPVGDYFTMGYEDAIVAAGFVQCKRVMGVHFNTFDIIKIDSEKAIKSFREADIELILPTIGQTIDL